MKITVFGATGAIGSSVIEQALAAGDEVTAFVRDASRVEAPLLGVRIVVGTLDDGPVVQGAMAGADAVISALGLTRNDRVAADQLVAGMRHIVAAMDAAGVQRIVAVSGAAVTLAGERKATFDRIVSALVRRLARWVVDAKRREYELLAGSGLDWTIVRPPRITDGGPTGAYQMGQLAIGPRTRATRGDVAALLLRCAREGIFIGEGPFIAS